MVKQLTLFSLLTFFALRLNADQYVTIGTNRFGFVFEDTTLTTNMQARIIDDWKIMTNPWTNFVIDITESEGCCYGNLNFTKILSNPDIEESLICNRFNLSTNGLEKFINIEKKLSDRYKSAIQFVDSHHDKISNMSTLISAVQSSSLSCLSSNEIINICYYHNLSANIYELAAEDIKQEILNMDFFEPSILSYGKMPRNYNSHPNEAFWCWIPFRNRHTSNISHLPAIYIDNRWKLTPIVLQ